MTETFWDRHGLYGLMAQFETPEQIVAAAQRAHDAGYRKMEAYSPMPIDGLAEAVGFERNWVSLVVLYFPINIAGRPLHSWPMFIPITFECTVLLAALSSVVGMLAMNKLPMPYHPVFNVTEFAQRASVDRFFLCIEANDPKFDREKTKAFLLELDPEEVSEVDK